jgi:transcriptional regulator with XRE-family HTH domain
LTVMSDSGYVPSLSLALRLEIARRDAGLTQDGMAAELGISKGTVSDFERGVRAPKRQTLMAWAARTGVSLRWLETGIAAAPDGGDGGELIQLPRLDSNQQPSGYRLRLVA